MDNRSKVQSSLDKDINRLRQHCEKLRMSNDIRKLQIVGFNNFIRKLLAEGRITKEEIAPFMQRKAEAREAVK